MTGEAMFVIFLVALLAALIAVLRLEDTPDHWQQSSATAWERRDGLFTVFRCPDGRWLVLSTIRLSRALTRDFTGSAEAIDAIEAEHPYEAQR